MGTGIGINCRRCREQLNYDDGFDRALQLCNRCKSIVGFEGGDYLKSLSEFTISELIYELSERVYNIDKSNFKKLEELYLEACNELEK